MSDRPSTRISLGVIADGWDDFCRMCMPPTVSESCKAVQRDVFFAGAVHIYQRIVGQNRVNPDGSLHVDVDVAECTRIEALEWVWERAIIEGKTETDDAQRIKALLDEARGIPN